MPTFRVVLAEHQTAANSGKFQEILGSYDARKEKRAELDKERIAYWLSKGAQPSGTLHNLFIDEGLIEGKKVNVLPQKSPVIAETPEGEEATAEEKPAEGEVAEAPAEETKEEAPAEEPAKEEKPVEEAPKEEAPKEEEEKPAEEPKEEATPAEETPAETPKEE